jgi:hypothetical protein
MINNIQVKECLKHSSLKVSDENVARLEMCINTHLLIVEEICGPLTSRKLEAGYRYGNVNSIMDALDAAACKVIGGCVEYDTSLISPFINDVLSLYIDGKVALKQCLQVLRYPLRLTLESESMSRSILDSNQSCFDWGKTINKALAFKDQMVPYRFGITGRYSGCGDLKRGGHMWFDHDDRPMVDEYGSFHFKSLLALPTPCATLLTFLPYLLEVASEVDSRIHPTYDDYDRWSRFSSGSTWDCGASLANKYKALEKYPTYADFVAYYGLDHSQKSKGLTVPKNFKEGRNIAELDAVRSYYAHGLREIILQAIPYTWRIDLYDQSESRHNADIGSRYHTYATIDSSKASDRVPWAAIQLLFPNIARESELLRDKWVFLDKDGNDCHEVFMFSTAGNPLTFVVESIFFYVIAETVRRFLGKYDLRIKYLETIVYGDDVEVDDRIAPEVITLMQAFNVKVNVRKSYFGSVPYREACGAEYLNGIECTTTYFPRGYKNTLVKKISLQHALYGFQSANDYLTRRILEEKPLMTMHVVGTPCTDLWGPVDCPVIKRACEVWKDVPALYADYPVKLYMTFVANRGRKLAPGVDRLVSAYTEALKHGSSVLGDVPLEPVTDDNFDTIEYVRIRICTTERISRNDPLYRSVTRRKDDDELDGSYRLLVD